MKILFIGYYELKEHLKHLQQVLEMYNYTVLCYPLFQYAYDSNDKLENYEEHLSDYIDSNDIDIILWWFLDVPVNVFRNIKKEYPNIYYILFNSDDPNNINTVSQKCEIFDLIITPCAGCIEEYRKINVKAEIIWSPPGFDPSFFFPIEKEVDSDSEYDCDISILCYDLLLDPYFSSQTVNRKIFLDNIAEFCKNHNKKFNIYGSYALKELYPDNYICDIAYSDHNSIINKSRINICTHTFNNYELSVSDLEFKILGARGLLFMDSTEKIQEIFINGVNCVLFTKNDYISKINRILTNYDSYDKIKDSGYNMALSYTWEKFIEKIHINISKRYFDAEYYRKMYNVVADDLWTYWLKVGLSNKHICYKLKVLPSFDKDKYCEDNALIDLDIDSSYHHWFSNGKKKKYIKKIDKSFKSVEKGLDVTGFNSSVEQIFDLYKAFNMIYSGDILSGLREVAEISRNNPNIKINDALAKYIDIVF